MARAKPDQLKPNYARLVEVFNDIPDDPPPSHYRFIVDGQVRKVAREELEELLRRNPEVGRHA